MEEISEEEKPPGNTPFFRAHNLEKRFKMNGLFIKFEGASLTGTQKDRISMLHALRAREGGYDTISLATCGNYGASISYFANRYGLKSVIAIPEFYSGERVEEMRSNGSSILEMPYKYEELVDYMRDRSSDENWYDSSPGSKNSELDIMGYENIAYEIASQLGHSPEFLSVPVGNGTTLAGIFSGFEKLYHSGEISRVPRLIASSTSNGNPIVASWKKKRRKVVDLDPAEITETSVSEPLVSFRSYDGQKALDSIYRSNGIATYVSDSEMVNYSRMIERAEKLSVLPASASAMAAADKVMRKLGYRGEVVVVLTGRNRTWITQ